MKVKAPVNTIVVIESLAYNEKQTGTELYNDIIKRYNEFYGNKVSTYFLEGDSKDQFLEALNFIIHNTNYFNLGILLHIEAHGLENKAGLSLVDGSSILWEDLKPKLIAINIATGNQLYVTMATCFGRFLHEAIDIKMQSPFSGYISASNEVNVNEILEDYSAFFETLVKTRDVFEAFETLDLAKSNFIYKDVETLFDDLLTDILRKLKNDREFIKEFTSNSKADYDRVKEDGFPAFEEMPFQAILNEVKKDFVIKYRDGFLFGKGR